MSFLSQKNVSDAVGTNVIPGVNIPALMVTILFLLTITAWAAVLAAACDLTFESDSKDIIIRQIKTRSVYAGILTGFTIVGLIFLFWYTHRKKKEESF